MTFCNYFTYSAPMYRKIKTDYLEKFICVFLNLWCLLFRKGRTTGKFQKGLANLGTIKVFFSPKERLLEKILYF